jgi:small-conductance mechanosensitive channel
VDKIIDIFNLGFSLGDARISIKSFALFLVVFFATRFFLKLLRRILTRKFTDDRKGKFKPIFGFVNYTIYSIIVLLALQNAGVNLNALLAASAALLVGVGFALQTFFKTSFPEFLS